MFISQRLYLITEKEITQKLEIPVKTKAELFEMQYKPSHLYLLLLSFARITNQEAVDSLRFQQVIRCFQYILICL